MNRPHISASSTRRSPEYVGPLALYDWAMPTGPKHSKHTEVGDGTDDTWAEECRCTIGEDHYVGDDFPLSEQLSATEAEDIYLSSGMDSDYDFR